MERGYGVRLSVHDGKVSCPLRGVVDVVECFMCGHGRGLSAERGERVICAATTDPATGRR